MGAALVQRALMQPIDADAKVLLCAMAMTALDVARNGQPAAIYYGGQNYLIAVIRGEIPDHGTPEYQAAEQAVKRRMLKLKRAGLIELTAPASRHRPARYQLHVGQLAPVDNVGDSAPPGQ